MFSQMLKCTWTILWKVQMPLLAVCHLSEGYTKSQDITILQKKRARKGRWDPGYLHAGLLPYSVFALHSSTFLSPTQLPVPVWRWWPQASVSITPDIRQWWVWHIRCLPAQTWSIISATLQELCPHLHEEGDTGFFSHGSVHLLHIPHILSSNLQQKIIQNVVVTV